MPARSFLHYVRYLCGADVPQTQTTAVERAALTRHAINRKRLAEIGVFEGASTRLLAEAMAPDGVLYAIDPFLAGRLGICWGKRIALREVAKVPPPRRVVFCELFSPQAARNLAGSFDFIFIDGDHSLEGIRRDWEDWAPRVEVGGLMALHDTRVPAHNPGVAQLGSFRYFEDHIRHDARFEMLEQVDSLSILRRQ